MNKIPIVIRNANLEIVTLILDSVARKYNCRVEYIEAQNRLAFHGDQSCCRHIAKEALGMFPAMGENGLVFRCPVN